MKPMIAALVLLFAHAIYGQRYSKLWGQAGELWTPDSPLRDHSRVAGYHEGKDPLPRWAVKVNVKDFGAKGDGVADDTKAITDAIKACPANAAVFLPVGKYKITDWIKLSGLRNIIIRGEDMYETQLIFPKGLEDIHSSPSRTTSGITTTSYSWGGGFFWFSNAEELGIENLNFIFPDRPYTNHFEERGYNMISISGKNNWMRNLRGYNADSGIYVSGEYMTLFNILLDAYPGRPQKDTRSQFNGRSGHHAIDIQGGKHNLVEKYTETIKYIHSLGSEGNAQWNVWHRCKGPDIEIDHHTSGAAMNYNLYTDIDMGIGKGSEGQRNIHTMSHETYWNLRSSQELPFDPANGGIKQGIPIFPADRKIIVVGWWLDWPDAEKNRQSASGPWYEYIGDYKDLYPPNIYLAQVKKRLGVANLAPEVLITRPLDRAAFPLGQTITVTAMPDDRDGSVAAVDLIVNGTLHSRKTVAPYEWTLTLSEKRTYSLVTVVSDNQGAVSNDAVHVGAGMEVNSLRRMPGQLQAGVTAHRRRLLANFFQERGGKVEMVVSSLQGVRLGMLQKQVAPGWNRITWEDAPLQGHAPHLFSVRSGNASQNFFLMNSTH